MKSFCMQIAGTISQCFLVCRGIASIQHYVVDLEISLNFEVRFRYDRSGPSVYHQFVFFIFEHSDKSLSVSVNQYSVHTG